MNKFTLFFAKIEFKIRKNCKSRENFNASDAASFKLTIKNVNFFNKNI